MASTVQIKTIYAKWQQIGNLRVCIQILNNKPGGSVGGLSSHEISVTIMDCLSNLKWLPRFPEVISYHDETEKLCVCGGNEEMNKNEDLGKENSQEGRKMAVKSPPFLCIKDYKHQSNLSILPELSCYSYDRAISERNVHSFYKNVIHQGTC